MNTGPGGVERPSWRAVLSDLPQAALLVAGARAELLASRREPSAGEPYGRRPLHRDELGEVMLADWHAGMECAPHDHSGGTGLVLVLVGAFTETTWTWRDGSLQRGARRRWQAGEEIPVTGDGIHSMIAHQEGTTLHFYRPAISGMQVFDPARRETLAVRDECGAWIPRDEALIVSRSPWPLAR